MQGNVFVKPQMLGRTATFIEESGLYAGMQAAAELGDSHRVIEVIHSQNPYPADSVGFRQWERGFNSGLSLGRKVRFARLPIQ